MSDNTTIDPQEILVALNRRDARILQDKYGLSDDDLMAIYLVRKRYSTQRQELEQKHGTWLGPSRYPDGSE